MAWGFRRGFNRQVKQNKGPVGPAPLPPTNTVAPAVTGTAQVGQTLTTTNGTWANSPTGFARRWFRNGAVIGGATGLTYVLTSTDLGATIRSGVVASNADGSSSEVLSNAVGPVASAGSSTVFVAILGGQSNMEGRASFRDPLVDTDVTDVYQFSGYPGDPNYRIIQPDISPLNSVDPWAGAGNPDGYGVDRVGPGEYIARQLLTDNPGCKVLLVPCAVGGTTLVGGTPKWNSSATPGAGGSLFENCIVHSNAAMAAAASQWPGATIVPLFFWVQGEFDASNFVSTAAYTAAQSDLIDRMRARITGAANAPFVIGSMIPRKWVIGSAQYNQDYANINVAHVGASLDKTGVRYVMGPNGSDDGLHYSPVDQVRTFGLRLGAALSDAVGPTMTSPATFSNQTGVALSLPLTCNDIHATFHINGGANAAQFEISDRYLTPTLRWVGNGTGPAAGSYVVGIRARDGSGNYGPTQNVTVTVSAIVSPTTFFTGGEKGMVWDLEAGNVFQNIDGTTPANVGDPVGWVRDQSPNANHWIAAANNTSRPTLQLNAFGKRVLRFNGTSQILFAAAPFADPQVRRAFTACAGVKAAAPGTNRDIVSAASTSSANQFYVPLQAVGTGAVGMSMRNDVAGGPGVVPSLPTTMLDGATTHIITSDYNGPSGTNTMRDENDRNTADGDDGSVSANQGTLSGPITLTRSSLGGRGGATPSAFFPGDISAGYVINRDLTPTEMTSGANWVDSLTGVGLP